MGQHFSKSGHLSKECYDAVNSIEYISLKTKPEMDIYEIYYINKWNPKYNVMDKHGVNMELKLNEETWGSYWFKGENDMKSLKEEFNKLQCEHKALKQKYKETLQMNELLVSYNKYEKKKEDDAKNFLHNKEARLLQKDIIRIYKTTNSEKLQFHCKLVENDILVGDYTIYNKDSIVFIKNEMNEDMEDSRIYDLKKEEDIGFHFMAHFGYIPNNKAAYKILQHILEEDNEKELTKYNFECTAEELIANRGANSSHLYEIVLDDPGLERTIWIDRDEISLTHYMDNKPVIKSISEDEFLREFKYNLFKYARYESFKSTSNIIKKRIDDLGDILC